MIRKSVVLAAGLAIAAGAFAAPPIPAYIQKAMADPALGADAQVDANRHIAELTAFAQVKPGDKVLELIPGAGHFTRVFSKVVGPSGHVYAVWPKPYDDESHPDSDRMRQLAKQPGFGNISVAIQPATHLSAPESLDVVFTSQNYHDYPDKFMGRVDPSVLNKDVYAALKPGGLYVIIDHVAQAGSGMRDTDTLHRIDPAIVKQQVLAAGFVFDGEIGILRNPADNHVLTVFDKAIRGHTDQFAYRFRKPLH